MHASNQCPIRRNAALATASFAIADGQQLRLGTIPCASDGTVLSIPRAATPQRHREAGQARGGFPSQSLSNRRFLPDVIDPPLH
jgi:hypothetical protein